RDRLLVQSPARLPCQHVQVLSDLVVAAWIAADQHRRQAVYYVRQADAAEALIELGPADDPVIGHDLEKGEHPPAGIGLQCLHLSNLHGSSPMPFPRRFADDRDTR